MAIFYSSLRKTMMPIKVARRRIFMLTWLLRIALALIVLVAAILGHFASKLFGFEAGLFVLVLVFVGLQLAIPLGALFMSAPGFPAQAAHVTTGRKWLASVVETFAFWRTFVVLMPFEKYWMGEEKSLPFAPHATPILLIPGYGCNRALWFDLERALKAAGRPVMSLTFDAPFADIDQLARQVNTQIALARGQTGAGHVLLVGHSMGGLVARAQIAQHGGDGVAGLIALATPHRGSLLARLAYGPNARQMEPDNAWLAALNAKGSPVPVHAFWAGRDELVSPPESARLPGAAETCVPLAGHYSLLRHREVLKAILSASA
jgi:pimeloyl-ACP methyl ester carboxylesterase